jgi:aspartokinase
MANKVLALKFGGTSVATASSRQLVVIHIRRALLEGYSPVVIVSAMGRRGAPYATDTLLDLIRSEGEPVSGRDEDLIFHCGEVISAAIMSHLLNLAGLPAVGLTGWQAQVYTDGRHRRGKIVRIDPSRMQQHIDRGQIPVVTGGQGVSEATGEITILGRGASDTSGVAIGVALGAEAVEIYTDVPGVAIADPRHVPDARFLDVVSYRKLYEIGIFGARVMHPGAVLVGEAGGVPIVCRSTFHEGPGTVITDTRDEPPLVGLPSMGPVDLLVLPRNALSGVYTQAQLFDQFAAAAIEDERSGRPVIAVAPDWREELGGQLAAQGVVAQEIHRDKSLVSLVGAPAFIAQSAEQAASVLQRLEVQAGFRERTAIRHTFAVPHARSHDLVRALYGEFAV